MSRPDRLVTARAVRLVVEGRVQGVGFRHWATREAQARGLDGCVRNLPDGSVEVLIAGPEELVSAMIHACRKGPVLAAVTAVREASADPPDIQGFREIR